MSSSVDFEFVPISTSTPACSAGYGRVARPAVAAGIGRRAAPVAGSGVGTVRTMMGVC